MNTEEYYAPFLARILNVLGITDLTAGVIDVRDEHDPISAAVLEEPAHVR